MNGNYEASERELLLKHISPADKVVELGSGIGFLANEYCKQSNQQHIAIEASPKFCELIKQNTKQYSNLRIINGIASIKSEPMTFNIYKDFWVSSLLELHLEHDLQLVEQVQIPTVNLDSLIKEHQTTLLICDIEGGEVELFQDFQLDVNKIILELHWGMIGFEAATQIITTLLERGYRISGCPDIFIAIRE